jgi:hypothetical protein
MIAEKPGVVWSQNTGMELAADKRLCYPVYG